MMRVLHIIGNANFGGIERLVITLAEVQSEQAGIQPEILFSSMKGEFVDKFEALGVPLHSADLSGGYDFSSRKGALLRNLFEGFDILHFHFFNIAMARCAVLSGVPVVYTEHGNFGFGRRTKFVDHVKRMLLSRFLNRRVSFLSFNSEFTRGFAEQRFGLAGTRRGVIYNGVKFDAVTGDATEIDTGISEELAGRFVIGTSSRFAGFKRIDRLVDGFAKFAKDIDDACLLLVGDGVTRSDLERQVDELGIRDKTVFAGYQSNVFDYQAAMDVCVFPSVNEPFGLVAIETLSLGQPTLVFRDGGGLVEILSALNSRDIVDDCDGLAARLFECYADRDSLRDADRVASRQARARQFDAQTMTDEFASIYQELSKRAA